MQNTRNDVLISTMVIHLQWFQQLHQIFRCIVLVSAPIFTGTHFQLFSFKWKLGQKCEKLIISKKVGKTYPTVAIADKILNVNV